MPKIQTTNNRYRPLTESEIKQYNDGTRVKTMTIPGSGDVIADRITEYYIASIKTDDGFGCAILHADDIIASHSGKNRVRKGYRYGSLEIYFKCENHWYKYLDTEGSTVTDVEQLVCDHLIGCINIDNEIERSQRGLITMQKIPAQPESAFFAAQPEESDSDFCNRIVSAAAYHRTLQEAKKEIMVDFYHKI